MTDRDEHPFAVPAGSEVNMFIQWKGTDVCLDFNCPCGRSGHFDGYFAYFLRCACGVVYEMGTQVIAKRVDTPGGIVQDLTYWADPDPEIASR